MSKTKRIKKGNLSPIHVTVNHSGKMEGMQSISTSCMDNKRCLKNASISGSICQSCYAFSQLKRQPSNRTCFKRNLDVLSSDVLSLGLLPRVNAFVFRLEAFGDLATVNQAMNYLNICYVNPNTLFTIWTKNPNLLKKAIDAIGKPSNLIVIFSDLFTNLETPLEKKQKRFPFVDKVFTVFDKETAKSVDVNCGKKKCRDCMICYSHNDVKQIREIKK